MRFIFFLLVLSFWGLIVSVIGFYLFGNSVKKKSVASNKANYNTTSKLDQLIKKHRFNTESTPISYNIDIMDSLSVTQYGNDLLKEFGNLSNFMLDLSNNSFVEQATINFKEITTLKEKNIDEDLFDKFNFISNYTKYKLIEQVKKVQPRISIFENKLSEFDNVINFANNIISNTKTGKLSNSVDNHKNMTLQANIELLKNKVISLKKNKLYYEQSIVQLKTIMNINNSIILNFDEVIHQVLPLMKNRKTLDSMKLVNFDSFNKMLKDLEKLSVLKVQK